MTMTAASAKKAITLATQMRNAGCDYDLGEVKFTRTDCTGMSTIMYNTSNGATGDNRFRWRFWTGSPRHVFKDLGFKDGLGPPGSFQIGVSTARELQRNFGHCGTTVMGVDIEMSKSNRIRVGGGARGADNPMFRHHFHIPIMGASMLAGMAEPAVVRYPGHPILPGSVDRESVKWVQGRLRFYGNRITVNGTFDSGTQRLVKKFQANRKAEASGHVGPVTWAMLAAPKYSHVLMRNISCVHVKRLKVALNRLGNNLDADNPTFGPRTEDVVERWQDRHGQRVTKHVGPLTWAWMHVPSNHPTPFLG